MSNHTKGTANALLTRFLLLATSVITCAFLPATGAAQPYTPKSNDSVVETLPAAISELSAEIRRAQKQGSDSTPNIGSDILQRAMASYQIAVTSGEARAYGRTLSILHSWPDRATPPDMYHILLAAVLQHNHAFAAALAQLQPVLANDTSNASSDTYIQALMMQSQIGLVTADYTLVEQSCNQLRRSARRPVFINCQAQLDGVTGSAEGALSLIAETFRAGTGLNTLDYQELLTTAAVIAHRLGEQATAETYYQGALRLAPDNTYLTVNYSNLLLEQNRFDELTTMLASDPENTLNTELRILLARALLAQGTEADRQQAAQITDALAQEFDLAVMRNEAIPHKEYAQHALYLTNSPADALDAAKQNWILQKEPSDTRLLAQAAATSNDRETLAEVAQWINVIGTQDVRLVKILADYREPSS